MLIRVRSLYRPERPATGEGGKAWQIYLCKGGEDGECVFGHGKVIQRDVVELARLPFRLSAIRFTRGCDVFDRGVGRTHAREERTRAAERETNKSSRERTIYFLCLLQGHRVTGFTHLRGQLS